MSTQNAATAVPGYKRLPIGLDGKLTHATKAILKSPRTQVIYSFPKTGKTDSMVDRSKFFVGDYEGGTDKFEGNNFCDLNRYDGPNPYVVTKAGAFIPAGLYETCQELYRANRMKEFNQLYAKFNETRSVELYDELVALINTMPFPIFVLDTLTSMMKAIYSAALAEYNASLSEEKQKGDIKRVDNYGGAQYIRRKVEDVKNFIEKNAAPFIIYNGHIKLKKSVLNKSNEEIDTADLAMEGQLPLIFTSSAEAVCVYIRNEEGCFVDYTKRGDDDKDARSRHLGNRLIKVSELHTFAVDEDTDEQYLKQKGEVYWNRIYPEIDFNN
jgi:hypothetical protein